MPVTEMRRQFRERSANINTDRAPLPSKYKDGIPGAYPSAPYQDNSGAPSARSCALPDTRAKPRGVSTGSSTASTSVGLKRFPRVTVAKRLALPPAAYAIQGAVDRTTRSVSVR
jgi:hypothetical protein